MDSQPIYFEGSPHAHFLREIEMEEMEDDMDRISGVDGLEDIDLDGVDGVLHPETEGLEGADACGFYNSDGSEMLHANQSLD